MLILSAFVLITLAWSAWLFGNVFSGAGKKIAFIGLLILSCVSTLMLYFKLGSHQELRSMANQHQQLADFSLEQLADQVDNQQIDINDLMVELRLRRKIEPSDERGWVQLGEVFIQLGRLDLAEQAFQRAVGINQDQAIQLETARYFIDVATDDAYQRATRKINLVLLDNPQHEGALLLQGINYFKQNNFQQAVEYWQRLLSSRQPGTESYQLIEKQIASAQHQIALQQNNRITIAVDGLDGLPLHRFTKAFALVRPVAGGAPFAVKSLTLEELQEPIYIYPENVMLAQTDLWQVTDIQVEIRLSQSGFAKPEPGDIYGFVVNQGQLTPGQTFNISLTQSID